MNFAFDGRALWFSAVAMLACMSAHAQAAGPGNATARVGISHGLGITHVQPVPQFVPRSAPNPAGLRSRFPAGLPPPVSRDAAGSLAVIDGMLVDTLPPPPGYVTGGGYAVPAQPQEVAVGLGPYSVVDVARSFLTADANRDGELTRAEARRLAIVPVAFEEMDLNHDGIVTRWEYEDALR